MFAHCADVSGKFKRATDIDDDEGTKIKKKDWDKLHVHIASQNNILDASGLDSSSASIACLGMIDNNLTCVFRSL